MMTKTTSTLTIPYAAVTQLDVNTMLLTRLDYTARSDLPFHTCRLPVIYLVLQGEYRVQASGLAFVCRAGQILCIHDKTNVPVEQGKEGLRLFAFSFTEQWCIRYGMKMPDTGSGYMDEYRHLSAYIQALYYQFSLGGNTRIMQKLLELICMELEEKKQPVSRWTSKLQTLINTRPAQLPPPAKLAKELGITERKLKTGMKKHTGYTYKNYHLRSRLMQAAELLLNTTDSVSVISDNCNFTDDSYFCNCFKKEFKTTPAEYRLQNRIL